MDRATIVEVTSWDSDGRNPELYDNLAADGAGGVVIKAAQGVGWTLPWLPAAVRAAKSAGLMVGVLSYAEPGWNDAQAEADHLLSSLPDDDLPLGLWLELDDLGGRQVFELTDWVKAWMEMARTPKARPVLLCTSTVYSQLAGAPFGGRWVQSDALSSEVEPWAQRVPKQLPSADPADLLPGVLYRLRSTRGLNAPESAPTGQQAAPAAPKAPPKPQTPEKPPPGKAPAGTKGEPVKVEE